MNITRLAISQNRLTLLAVALLFLSGLGAYRAMPKAEDPGFTVRTAQVLTVFPGAGPERVEMLVTDKLEKVIQEMPEVDFVTSTSKTNVSSILVNIKQSYRDIRPIFDKLRRKVESVRDLPEGVVPVVNDEFGDVFGIIVGLTGEGFDYAGLEDAAEAVRDELLRLPDVAKVEISGVQEEKVYIEYDNATLARLGFTTAQLRQTLAATNIIFPGGDVRVGAERVILEPSGNFETLDDIRRIIVQAPGGEMVYLGDIARVYRGYVDPPAGQVSVNGRRGLALAVSLKEGGNLIALGAGVEARLAALRGVFPLGLDFDVIAYQHRIVDAKVDNFVSNVLQSILVVVGVMLLFLGLRTGLVVATLIPVTMVGSLVLMTAFGIGLDQVSLAALIIALGMLVDNAIVMAESIMVRLEKGEERVTAAVAAAAELRTPLLISSLTTAAAFLPIFLAESKVGEFTSSLFTVISIALLLSWGLALTLIPLCCVLFLTIKKTAPGSNPPAGAPLSRYYGRLLRLSLRRPGLFLALTAGIFALAIAGFRRIPVIFFPPSDRNLVTAELELPEGTAIEHTTAVMNALDRYVAGVLRDGDLVENWGAWVGSGAPKYALTYQPPTPGPNLGYMLLNTTGPEGTRRTIDSLRAFCARAFPELTPTIKTLSSGPASKYDVEVRLSGRDVNQLYDLADQVRAQLRDIPGVANVGDTWGPRAKKLQVDIDQARANLAGVTSQDIAVSLQTALSGVTASDYREGEKAIPIVMRTVASERQDLGKLESINVYAQRTGRTVPLNQVADVDLEWQAAKILRRNRYRTIGVTCALTEGVTAKEVDARLRPWLETAGRDWPPGYHFEIGGESEASAEANASIKAKLPVAGLLIILLLVGQFNSLRKAGLVLLTIPLGIVGVVAGLLLTGSYFGFMTFLGVVSLAGIVINNAIVLIDRIQIEIDENGLRPADAIVEAARQRLRPILLTTATTVAGLVPLWLGGGPMWEPMAIAIIFGLLFATGITLLFVPVGYKLAFRVRDKLTG